MKYHIYYYFLISMQTRPKAPMPNPSQTSSLICLPRNHFPTFGGIGGLLQDQPITASVHVLKSTRTSSIPFSNFQIFGRLFFCSKCPFKQTLLFLFDSNCIIYGQFVRIAGSRVETGPPRPVHGFRTGLVLGRTGSIRILVFKFF